MLQALLPVCYQGYYRMLKQPLGYLPVNLHLCVNNNMGYFSFDNVEKQTTYLMLNETALSKNLIFHLIDRNTASYYHYYSANRRVFSAYN